jgi:hypothetical protein
MSKIEYPSYGCMVIYGTGVSGESRQLHVNVFRVANTRELGVNLGIVDATTGATVGTFHLDSEDVSSVLKHIIDWAF